MITTEKNQLMQLLRINIDLITIINQSWELVTQPKYSLAKSPTVFFQTYANRAHCIVVYEGVW